MEPTESTRRQINAKGGSVELLYEEIPDDDKVRRWFTVGSAPKSVFGFRSRFHRVRLNMRRTHKVLAFLEATITDTYTDRTPDPVFEVPTTNGAVSFNADAIEDGDFFAFFDQLNVYAHHRFMLEGDPPEDDDE